MQRVQFHAKSAKNDLKPTDFLKHNFYFETEGVYGKLASGKTVLIPSFHPQSSYQISVGRGFRHNQLRSFSCPLLI